MRKTPFKKQKNQTRRVKRSKLPIVYGRVYALWCGHCKSMDSYWKEHGLGVKIANFDIESNEIDTKKSQFKEIYGSDIDSPGYPTIYKLYEKGGPIEYYNGERSKKQITKWLFAKPAVKSTPLFLY